MKEKSLFPKEIQRDYDWAFRNYHRLAKRYPERWVAFAHQRVLASGPSLMPVLRKARRQKGAPKGPHVPHLFVESEVHIYAHLHRA